MKKLRAGKGKNLFALLVIRKTLSTTSFFDFFFVDFLSHSFGGITRVLPARSASDFIPFAPLYGIYGDSIFSLAIVDRLSPLRILWEVGFVP